jgi:ligand-binding sensor domain-containing protein
MKFWLSFILSFTVQWLFAQQPNFYFNRITTQNGLSHNKVNCIVGDKRGFIWMGTDDGLNRYDGHNFTIFRNDPADSTTISGNIITDLLEDEQGIIWIATADGGITKYNYRLPAAQQFKQYKHLPANNNSIPVNIINKLLLDKKGYLWLATSGYFAVRFNRITETFETPVKKGTKTVLSLALDNNEVLWAGRQGGSILKINTNTLQYQTDERYNNLYANLPHATVTALYNDKQGNMWFGSWDKILYHYSAKDKKETAVDTKKFNDEATCFAEDASENLWIGGKYHGLYFVSHALGTIFQLKYDAARAGTIASNKINTVFTQDKGMVWIGTDDGVSVFDATQHQFKQIFLPVANKSITIFDFYEDEQSNLWMATSDGIYIRNQSTNIIVQHPLQYKGEALQVSKFFKDSKGNFLIGTNYTVFLLNRNNFTVQPLPNTEKDGVMSKIIK